MKQKLCCLRKPTHVHWIQLLDFPPTTLQLQFNFPFFLRDDVQWSKLFLNPQRCTRSVFL